MPKKYNTQVARRQIQSDKVLATVSLRARKSLPVIETVYMNYTSRQVVIVDATGFVTIIAPDNSPHEPWANKVVLVRKEVNTDTSGDYRRMRHMSGYGGNNNPHEFLNDRAPSKFKHVPALAAVTVDNTDPVTVDATLDNEHGYITSTIDAEQLGTVAVYDQTFDVDVYSGVAASDLMPHTRSYAEIVRLCSRDRFAKDGAVRFLIYDHRDSAECKYANVNGVVIEIKILKREDKPRQLLVFYKDGSKYTHRCYQLESDELPIKLHACRQDALDYKPDADLRLRETGLKSKQLDITAKEIEQAPVILAEKRDQEQQKHSQAMEHDQQKHAQSVELGVIKRDTEYVKAAPTFINGTVLAIGSLITLSAGVFALFHGAPVLAAAKAKTLSCALSGVVSSVVDIASAMVCGIAGVVRSVWGWFC